LLIVAVCVPAGPFGVMCALTLKLIAHSVRS
jgi:hypothetical protein